MKKKKFSKKLKLKKISVANLNEIEGGARNIALSYGYFCTTDPTAQTYCYICPPRNSEIYCPTGFTIK